MDIIKEIEVELRALECLIRHYEKQIEKSERGDFVAKERAGGSIEYYLRKCGGELEYVKRKDQYKLDQIRKYHFSERMLSVLNRNHKELSSALSVLQPYDHESINQSLKKKYRLSAEYSDRTTMVRQSEKERIDDNIAVVTSFGLRVRSKSECAIAESLYAAGVKFYYERKMELADEYGRTIDVYPDFTIVLPDGSFIIWEHKGMLDNPDYVKRDEMKMRLYYRNNIYSGHNLIITIDGKNKPFDTRRIWRIIEGMILPEYSKA